MLKTFDYLYQPINKNRKVYLYLPDNYDKTDDHYPVVYFFDGQNIFLDQNATFGRAWRVNDYLSTINKDFIVVGLVSGETNDIRTQEYVPYNCLDYYHNPVISQTDEVYNWLINDLKPYIDNNYRTIPFRECTALVGSSYGGICALKGILKYNNYFSKCGALSPSVIIIMNELLNEIAVNNLNPDTRIFFSYGEKEGSPIYVNKALDSIHLLESNLHNKKVLTQCIKQIKGKHNESSWEKLLPDLFNFLWFDN